MTTRSSSVFVAPGPDRIGLRRTDRLPALVMKLVDDTDNAIDLTDATVWVFARRRTGVPIAPINNDWTTGKQCLIIDAVNGTVYYDIQELDTRTNPGDFDVACLIRFSDNTEVVVPTESTATVTIGDEIGGQTGVVDPLRLFG